MLSLAHHCGVVAILIGFLGGCVPRDPLAPPKLNAQRDLIVFVGKRLSVTKQTAEQDSMDEKFEARYRVLQLVFGRYEGTEITFTVYDHYGSPSFAQYDTALMFVARYEGKLYHEKYQYFAVYPTRDGRWASCGDPYSDEPPVHRGALKPHPIEFATAVHDRKAGRPCTEGNYVEELLPVKENGVLKARGWVF